MNINKITIGEAKEITKVLSLGVSGDNTEAHAFEVGKSYFIRSVTHHYLGTVREIKGLCLVMDTCVWIADDGRFHSLMKGTWDDSSEREPWPKSKRVQLFYGAFLDATEWEGDIPTDVK